MPSDHPNTLQHWLERIESFHPQEIDLGLDRIRVIAESLDCIHFKCPIISVAGTNGKGSTVESLKQLAMVKGLNVGSYTSPHLFEFNERIAINGNCVTDEDLIQTFESIEKFRLKNPDNIIPLSFFEYTTLAALLLFKKAQLDLIILEVGLGGRLDAVNIVDADIAIITSIGIDHVAWLGDTREHIALEKAGIARKDCICIIGDSQAPKNLVPYLNILGAKILEINKDFSFTLDNSNVIFLLSDVKNSNSQESFELPIKNLHLAPENIVLALQAFYSLGLGLTHQELQQALAQTQLLGRFQTFEIKNKGLIICDLTHNPAGAQFLLKQLQNYFHEHSLPEITILLGVMADKDIEGIAEVFLDITQQWLVCDMQSTRAAKAKDLKRLLQQLIHKNPSKFFRSFENILTFDSVASGLEHYLTTAEHNSCLLVIGSFFSVGPVLKILSK